ncbi:MAG: SDR family oxidoreductase [Deltaproteobacteria bacterium]|nr:SDR family oxidoreductase [Deltaproteobacteria bacterium]
MELELSDKVVLVTGASGGIGRAIAESFAEEGARLALLGHARSAELEDQVRAQGLGDRTLTCGADVTRPEEVEAAFERTVERFGRIDVCVACAGVWPPETGRLDELPVERVRRTIEVDLLGAIWTARAFLGTLARTGPRPDGHGAALVLIGSTAGRFGEAGHADYAAAKAALRGLALSLKNEIVALDPYGRVNVVEPGWTVTPMARAALADPSSVARVVRTMPLRQLARPEDVARAVVLLASPAASRHVSGEFLAVAGGMEGRVRWDADEVDPAAVRARLDPDGAHVRRGPSSTGSA